jgi:hypothetical protein
MNGVWGLDIGQESDASSRLRTSTYVEEIGTRRIADGRGGEVMQFGLDLRVQYCLVDMPRYQTKVLRYRRETAPSPPKRQEVVRSRIQGEMMYWNGNQGFCNREGEAGGSGDTVR